MKNAILGALCAVLMLMSLAPMAPTTGDLSCIHPNAIRSFHLGGTAASYTTSTTKKFLITDVIGVSTSGSSLTLRVNGQLVLVVPEQLVEFNVGGPGGTLYNQTFDPIHLVSGIPCAPGSVITESSGLQVTVCGYEY